MPSIVKAKDDTIEDIEKKAVMNRLDIQVLSAFQKENTNVVHTRKYILDNWRNDEKYKSLGLSSIQGFDGISLDQEHRAVNNLVDYWFEPHFLITMNAGQLRDYFQAVEDIFNIEFSCDIPIAGEKPLLIDGIHHYLGFSLLFSLCKLFVTEFGYKRILILHGRENTDPRLELVGTLISQLSGCEIGNVLMDKNWTTELGKQVNQSTVIVYMGDMSPLLFSDMYKKGKTSSEISLYTQSGDRFSFEGFSISKFLARRLKAHHLSVSYPEEKTLQICDWENKTKSECPVYDWIYWPALFKLYFPL